jgi:Putative homoserine kinase type II (protein kinase fold)
MEVDEASRISERYFGEEPRSVDQIVGGVMNNTFRLKYDTSSYILQVDGSADAHEMENNLNCFRYLRDSRVPVPQTVTEQVREYDSRLYIIVEDLKVESLDGRVTPEKTRNAGRYLAHIHDLRSFDKVGWWGWEGGEPKVLGFPGGSLRGRIEDNLEDNLEYFDEQNIGWLAEASRRFLDDYLGLVPTSPDAVFVHHDYNPGNILVNSGVVGILDFDYAHSSHSQRDLVKSANNFWIRSNVARQHIYKGYQEVRRPGERFDKNEPLYRLETLIDILKGYVEHDQIEPEEVQKYSKYVKQAEEELRS